MPTAMARLGEFRFVRTNRITCYTIFFDHMTGLVTSHLLSHVPGHMMGHMTHHVTDHAIGFMSVARSTM